MIPEIKAPAKAKHIIRYKNKVGLNSTFPKLCHSNIADTTTVYITI